VGFDIRDQLQIRFLAFSRYRTKNVTTVRQEAMIQLGEKHCTVV
jgi:hypothetical protein